MMKIAENDRDMLEYLTEACESQVYVCDQCGHEEALSTFDIASDLRDYMATEQQQSEPVAWIEVADLKEITKGARWSGTAWGRPADDKGLYRLPPRVPVYTHADPGEVERLTGQLEVANQAIAYAARQAEEKQKITDVLMADAKQFRAERDTLRAKLAEQDALLERAYRVAPPELGRDIRTALSASTEPSASEEPKGDTLRAQLAERDRQLECAVRLLMPNAGQFRGSGAWAVEVDRFIAGLKLQVPGQIGEIPQRLSKDGAPTLADVKANCNHIFAARGHLFVCVHCEVLTDCPVCVGKRTVPSAKAGYVMDCPVCCGEEG